jgi:hypothetical protein
VTQFHSCIEPCRSTAVKLLVVYLFVRVVCAGVFQICEGGLCWCVSDSSSDFSSDSTDSDDAKKKHPKDLKSIQETNRLVFWLCYVHDYGILHSKPKVC